MPLDISGQNRCREEVIGRNIEKTLNLTRMEIECQNPVGACRRHEVGDELGGDGCAGGRLAVLACIAEIRNNRGYAARRGALQRILNNQQFHQVVVCRIGG